MYIWITTVYYTGLGSLEPMLCSNLIRAIDHLMTSLIQKPVQLIVTHIPRIAVLHRIEVFSISLGVCEINVVRICCIWADA